MSVEERQLQCGLCHRPIVAGQRRTPTARGPAHEPCAEAVDVLLVDAEEGDDVVVVYDDEEYTGDVAYVYSYEDAAGVVVEAIVVTFGYPGDWENDQITIGQRFRDATWEEPRAYDRVPVEDDRPKYDDENPAEPVFAFYETHIDEWRLDA